MTLEKHDATPIRSRGVVGKCVECETVITRIHKRTGKVSKWRHIDPDERNR